MPGERARAAASQRLMHQMRGVTIPSSSLRLDISRVLLGLLAAALFAGCSADGSGGSTAGQPSDADAMDVVATTTVFADLVRQVGGSHVRASSLVPPGGEVHTFDPTPADIARVADADLIVMNGLGLDEWAAQIVEDSGSDAPIVELGENLDGVTYLAGGEHEGEGGEEHTRESAEAHADEEVNPHLWLNVAYAIKYAERIGDALATVDPAHADAFREGTTAYVVRLNELDDWARAQIDTIPESDRRIVSFHEAFPYFAAAYGLEIVGTVIDAPGQDPSAGEIADLVDAIRSSGARAVFSEAQFNPDLARTIATEAGVEVESDLYNDSLGDPPADTYEGMIRWDVDKVVEALRP